MCFYGHILWAFASSVLEHLAVVKVLGFSVVTTEITAVTDACKSSCGGGSVCLAVHGTIMKYMHGWYAVFCITFVDSLRNLHYDLLDQLFEPHWVCQ